MVNNGHMTNNSGIKRVDYRNPARVDLGVAVLDSDHARRLRAPGHFVGPQRPEFYQLLFFTEGRGTHTVDLVRYRVSPGVLIVVTPGQVQEWDEIQRPKGRIVLIHPSFLLPDRPEYREVVWPAPSEEWPVRISLSASESLLVKDSLDELQREITHADGSPLAASLLLHLLYVLLIRLRRMAGAQVRECESENDGEVGLYREFRLEVERGFRETRSVADYARRLGCSEKSVYRAVFASTGSSPKRLIDERVAMEAQRLLLHTKWSLKRIAGELGFSQPTNFLKFFRRTVEETPSEFRRRLLSG